MRISFKYPSNQTLSLFLREKQGAFFNYQEQLGTKHKTLNGYDNDHSSILLGQGINVWDKAKSALNNWQQFPSGWTKIYTNDTSIKEGNTVLVLFKLFGLWWWNAARIVYLIDEKNRYGYAYGTLHGHVERGEECFWIDRDESGNVYYHIKAFSKPAFWGARLFYPMARMYQRKFVRDSLNEMKLWTNES